jgi:hypothetical protein
MSDTFRLDARTCEIRYAINGSQKVLTARVDSDWVDPKAAAAFMRDIERTVADGRHFWAADNGQASILFFLTDAEAAGVNALREDTLSRYTSD